MIIQNGYLLEINMPVSEIWIECSHSGKGVDHSSVCKTQNWQELWKEQLYNKINADFMLKILI